MSQEIQASPQYFDKVWREKMLEDIKRRSSPSYALQELQRNRREDMMAIIDRGIADISKILEENLFQIKNHYIEPKINIEEKDSLIEREETKESEEKEVEEKGEEKENEKEKEKEEKNVGKFWPTITLVPSSKLVCVFRCWDSSSNIIQLPNISLCHEGNKENEEKISQQVEGNYVLWKNDYVPKSQGEKFLHSSLQFYAGLDLRSNPLEEGENDEIKSLLNMWKEAYKKMH
ncbi:hypothetical protein MTR_1g053035 [Medicago truncatula]|uniref:Uncharacterized protein n=1 Tax=Medicago truncatula TaxID=3880 RepID=A0A072VU33_MEDTR|nr:hypothetical protein MTR_1g053035 [Medicago truncatula]